jgi:hypothetical protein
MVIALFAGVMLLDYIPGWKSRKKKVNLVYGMMLALSLLILFLFSVGVNVPSPSKAIHSVVKMIAPIK